MTIAHVATASTLRGELADAEDLYDALQRELHRAQKEVLEARRAGTAVLGAVENAMAPMMAELAAARCACSDDDDLIGLAFMEDEQLNGRNPCENLEAELQHLELDIKHYQEQVEHLQIEERERSHELGRLRSELSEASEHLSYERQSVQHYQVCQQLGLEGSPGWAGLGPAGIGRRTMEVQAEKKLRELSEQRTGRLSGQVARLASDTAAQQSTISNLSKRLGRVRQSLDDKDKRISDAMLATTDLHARLKGVSSDTGALNASRAPRDMASTDPGCVQEGPSSCTEGNAETVIMDTSGERASPGVPAAPGKGARTKRPHKGASSTGKLPQLSF